MILRLLRLLAVCALLAVRAPAAEIADTFHADKLAQMDAAITLAIADGRCPGGVLWLERDGAAFRKSFGARAVEPEREAMTEDTIFDAASLTKVIATTTSVMQFIERGQFTLDTHVSEILAEFRGAGKEAITVRHLLTHTSGLPPTSSSTGGGISVSLAWNTMAPSTASAITV